MTMYNSQYHVVITMPRSAPAPACATADYRGRTLANVDTLNEYAKRNAATLAELWRQNNLFQTKAR